MGAPRSRANGRSIGHHARQLREALCQAEQERRSGCGGDLRGGDTAHDALCRGKDGGAAEPDDAAPDPIAVGPSTHHAGERHSRASCRVRHRGAGWSAGGEEAGFDRFRPDGRTAAVSCADLPREPDCVTDHGGVGSKPTARAKAGRVLALKAEGVGATEIAKRLEIGRASVYRILADQEAA